MKEEKGEQLYLKICTQMQTQLYLMVGTQLLLLRLNLQASSCPGPFTRTLNKPPVACSPGYRAWPMPSRILQ
jgi:hypothetical protein